MFLIFLAVIKTLLNYVFSKYVEYLSWIYKELHMEIKERWCFKKYAPMKRRQRDTIRLYLNV